MPDSMKPEDFRRVYDGFEAALSRFDCGRFCSPLNGGTPVCCSTDHAIPIIDKAEFRLLRGRSDLWSRFRAQDADSRRVVADLHPDCLAVACKGARFCERENRSLACRAFPFYPYFTREGEMVGLATYWIFADRCWIISNLAVVERDFVREFVAAFDYVLARDAAEREAMILQSANHRRVFSRRKRIIPLIGRAGGYFKAMPHGGEIRPARLEEFKPEGPYKSAAAYARAVKKARGVMPEISPFTKYDR